ncbi:MAG: hypothetical protein VCD34_13410, partial [Planctomycetota bacterium]
FRIRRIRFRSGSSLRATGSVFRQLRGGGWYCPPFSVRSAYRCNFPPQDGDADVGFRPSSPVPWKFPFS